MKELRSGNADCDGFARRNGGRYRGESKLGWLRPEVASCSAVPAITSSSPNVVRIRRASGSHRRLASSRVFGSWSTCEVTIRSLEGWGVIQRSLTRATSRASTKRVAERRPELVDGAHLDVHKPQRQCELLMTSSVRSVAAFADLGQDTQIAHRRRLRCCIREQFPELRAPGHECVHKLRMHRSDSCAGHPPARARAVRRSSRADRSRPCGSRP